ncbi:MAG: hypothetical protein U0798_06455 [Gemmataceae bacterium]
MIESKKDQRLAGLFTLGVSIAGTFWLWQKILSNESVQKILFFFPGMAVFGLGLLLFPIDMEEFRKRTGLDRPKKVSDYPPIWKAIGVSSVIIAVANYFLMITYAG